MDMKYWEDKDPDEVIDRGIDWTPRLPEGDSISSSTWISPVGITVDSETSNAFITVIWLSGGILGETYKFTNRITTTQGRTMDTSVKLRISSK